MYCSDQKTLFGIWFHKLFEGPINNIFLKYKCWYKWLTYSTLPSHFNPSSGATTNKTLQPIWKAFTPSYWFQSCTPRQLINDRVILNHWTNPVRRPTRINCTGSGGSIVLPPPVAVIIISKSPPVDRLIGPIAMEYDKPHHGRFARE